MCMCLYVYIFLSIYVHGIYIYMCVSVSLVNWKCLCLKLLVFIFCATIVTIFKQLIQLSLENRPLLNVVTNCLQNKNIYIFFYIYGLFSQGIFLKRQNTCSFFLLEVFFSVNVIPAFFVISKNYFNPAKIFVSNFFKIVADQTEFFMLEQRSVIKFLLAEKCKLCEIYRTMYHVYGLACFSQSNVYKWVKHGFITTNLSQKDSPWYGKTDWLVKKKFLSQ